MGILKEYSLFLELFGLLSVLTFIGSLIAIPWILSRLPTDYFIRHRYLVEKRHERHPVLAKITFVLRNLLGLLFLLAGVAMLILPFFGQVRITGIQTMAFITNNQISLRGNKTKISY